MTQSIYPEIRFVGREDELKRFEQILEQHAREKWAILLHGPGGIGKTQLLKKFLQLAREKYSSKEESLVFSEDDIIDLYWTEHRREESLLRSLAYRLDPRRLQEFFAASEDYAHDIVSDEDTVGLERLRDAFLMGVFSSKNLAKSFWRLTQQSASPNRRCTFSAACCMTCTRKTGNIGAVGRQIGGAAKG